MDAVTRKPMSVSIPRQGAHDGSYLTMLLETPDARNAHVLLTYVTEAPAWKPSYRVVIGDGGKVMLEGWAIVDNMTSEDWKGVLVGVGASSALAFRYDLWSVRQVDRDLLEGEERFAIAPPTGLSPYAEATAEELTSLDPDEVRGGAPDGDGDAIGDGVSASFSGSSLLENQYFVDGANTTALTPGSETIQLGDSAPVIDPAAATQGVTIDHSYTKNIPVPGRTFESALGSAAGSQGDSGAVPPSITRGDEKLAAIAARVLADRRDVVVEVHGAPGRALQAHARGEAVKHTLVDRGVPASRIRVVPKLSPGAADDIRVLAVPPSPRSEGARGLPRDLGDDTPVGESHFMADRPMTVRAGTSAMVAMLHTETTGGVVYLYDPISERGHDRYAFKAVRIDNPTSDTLEAGPVTVYGEGRFIGEGITEPVPPRASVVVPYALDKQVIVARDTDEADRIAKLVTVQRGTLTAEVQHRRQSRFTVTSRLPEPATVYLRHRLASGWTLLEHPPTFTRVGDSHLFEIELQPGETKHVTIAEATPIERSLQLGSDEALGMLRVYVDEPDASPALVAQLEALLETQRTTADLEAKIDTLREQLGEYRARSRELQSQLVTLKLVKTGGPLMAALRSRLAETSERVQKTTIALVDAQEQLMLARINFQNQIADLRLSDPAQSVGTAEQSR